MCACTYEHTGPLAELDQQLARHLNMAQRLNLRDASDGLESGADLADKALAGGGGAQGSEVEMTASREPSYAEASG